MEIGHIKEIPEKAPGLIKTIMPLFAWMTPHLHTAEIDLFTPWFNLFGCGVQYAKSTAASIKQLFTIEGNRIAVYSIPQLCLFLMFKINEDGDRYFICRAPTYQLREEKKEGTAKKSSQKVA
jgi:hypothetical protein